MERLRTVRSLLSGRYRAGIRTRVRLSPESDIPNRGQATSWPNRWDLPKGKDGSLPTRSSLSEIIWSTSGVQCSGPAGPRHSVIQGAQVGVRQKGAVWSAAQCRSPAPCKGAGTAHSSPTDCPMWETCPGFSTGAGNQII